MEADGRFFEDEQIAAGEAFEGVRFPEPRQEVGHQLDPLSLAAAEGGAGLTEMQVAQAGVVERLQRAFDARDAGEELQGRFDGQLEHLGDVASGVSNIERLGVEAGAAAGFTPHKGGRQEVHFQLRDPGPFAGRTTPLAAVK